MFFGCCFPLYLANPSYVMAQYLKALHPGGILLESKNITNDAIIISHGMDIKAALETLDNILLRLK